MCRTSVLSKSLHKGTTVGRIVSDTQIRAKSRPAVIALVVLTLRLMENWRGIVREIGGDDPDTDAAMITLAVVAIGAEKFTRADLDPELGSLAMAMPPGRLNKCNISSIASATGINRETVRRKVARLQELGILSRKQEPDGIRVTSAFAAREEVQRSVHAQVDALVRAWQQLRSYGVVKPH
jgi:DNA-binding transcriptional ArsR family regulator